MTNWVWDKRRMLLLALLFALGCSGESNSPARDGVGGDGDDGNGLGAEGIGGPGDGDNDFTQNLGDGGPLQDTSPQMSSGSLDFDCGDVCSKATVGPLGSEAFDLVSDPSERVLVDPDGALVLDRDGGPGGPPVIWIADQGNEHTVLKVNTETLEQLARYRVGPNGQDDPSRTAVDGAGNVYVGNRGGEGSSWQGQGKTSVTKVLNAGCTDLNGDGMVTTSTGPNDVLPWGQDECIAWHVPYPHDVRAIAAQDVPAVVIDGPDGDMLIPAERYVWVSGMNGGPSQSGQMAVLRKLNAKTGATVFDVDAYPAYGMALDGQGNLWMDRGRSGGGVQRIDTTMCVDQASCAVAFCENVCNASDCTDANDGCAKQLITGMPGGQGYGITVDLKQRVWLGGYSGDLLKRYDQTAPANQRFTGSNIAGINGIAADGEGFIWGAQRGGGLIPGLGGGVLRIDAETLATHMVVDGDAKGMAIDKQGKVWAISQSNYATMVVPGPTLMDNVVSQPVTTLSSPYTYSDMTGQQARLASNDPGYYTRLLEGCAAETNWAELAWDADLPMFTLLRFSIRSAPTIMDLEAADWISIAVAPPDVSPVSIAGKVMDKYLEVEVQLVANDPDTPGLSPKVYGFGASYDCPLLE